MTATLDIPTVSIEPAPSGIHQAVPFMRALFGTALASTYIVVSDLERQSQALSSRSFPADRPDYAAEYATGIVGRDVYVRVCPTSQAFRGSERGTAEHTAAVTALWIDADYATPDKPGYPANAAAVRGVVREWGIGEPSIVVDSGHGLHLYWLLAEPVADITRDPDEKFRSPLLKRWKAAVLHRFGAAGFKLDKGAYDAARVLRVPGTFNYKSDPIPVRLLRCEA